MTKGTVTIVGGGQAGFQVAASLRAGGHDGPIQLLGAETWLPYQRPPLSKGLLLGKMERERLLFRQAGYYAAQGIELLLGETATAIDSAARLVARAAGPPLPYDALVLATGTRVRPLLVPGTGLDGVVYLRTIDDAEDLARRIAAARRVAVVGGGFIGLEVAAAARLLGRPVTVLEAADRLMGRVVAPSISAFYADLHRGRGVELVLDARVVALDGDGWVAAVATADGTRHPADLVVIGIGVLPNVELAAAAGIACADGILVDAHGRTSAPGVHAAGECASHPSRFAGGQRVRLESVQNAVDQARAVAATILGGDEPYDEVPWFWSDQYEVKLQMVGLSRGHDLEVLRGVPADGRFSVCYFRDGRLIAIDSVNRPSDHMTGRKLLTAGISPTPAQAADADFELKALLKG